MALASRNAHFWDHWKTSAASATATAPQRAAYRQSRHDVKLAMFKELMAQHTVELRRATKDVNVAVRKVATKRVSLAKAKDTYREKFLKGLRDKKLKARIATIQTQVTLNQNAVTSARAAKKSAAKALKRVTLHNTRERKHKIRNAARGLK